MHVFPVQLGIYLLIGTSPKMPQCLSYPRFDIQQSSQRTTLLGTGGSTYLLRSHMIELPEYHEARMVCHISITALSQWYAQHL
jgi:hypothetical protein